MSIESRLDKLEQATRRGGATHFIVCGGSEDEPAAKSRYEAEHIIRPGEEVLIIHTGIPNVPGEQAA